MLLVVLLIFSILSNITKSLLCYKKWLTEIHHQPFWTDPVLLEEHLDQKLAPDRPTCAGSGSNSAEQSQGQQVESPRWMPCLGSACNMASLSVTAATTDCLQPIKDNTILWKDINNQKLIYTVQKNCAIFIFAIRLVCTVYIVFICQVD